MKNLFFLSLIFITACRQTSDFKKDGGVRIVLEADALLTKETKGKCMAVLANRLDFFGVGGVTIRVGENQNQIIAEFPGNYDLGRLKKLLQQSGKISFYETFENKELYSKLNILNTTNASERNTDSNLTVVKEKKKAATGNSLNDQLAGGGTEVKNTNQLRKENPLFSVLSPAIQKDNSENFVLQPGPVIGYAIEKDTMAVNSVMNDTVVPKIFGPHIKFLWTLKPANEATGMFQLVAVRVERNGEATLSGNIIQDAKKVFDSSHGGKPQISLTMTQEAGFTWARMTRQNIGKSIAIVSENHVVSYPTVLGEIKEGKSNITGNFTSEEADDLVNVMKSGDLPVTMHIVKEKKILPSK